MDENQVINEMERDREQKQRGKSSKRSGMRCLELTQHLAPSTQHAAPTSTFCSAISSAWETLYPTSCFAPTHCSPPQKNPQSISFIEVFIFSLFTYYPFPGSSLPWHIPSALNSVCINQLIIEEEMHGWRSGWMDGRVDGRTNEWQWRWNHSQEVHSSYSSYSGGKSIIWWQGWVLIENAWFLNIWAKSESICDRDWSGSGVRILPPTPTGPQPDPRGSEEEGGWESEYFPCCFTGPSGVPSREKWFHPGLGLV